MGDKHLFKKKKKDAVETETMAPDIENQNGQVQTDTDSEKAEHEFVYGMEESDDQDKGDIPESADHASGEPDSQVESPHLGSPENIIECDSLVKIYKTDDVEVMALQAWSLT